MEVPGPLKLSPIHLPQIARRGPSQGELDLVVASAHALNPFYEIGIETPPQKEQLQLESSFLQAEAKEIT